MMENETKMLAIVFTLLFGYASGDCLIGWTRHENSCYHFSHDMENWAEAFALCKVLGGYLVEINDVAEGLYIENQVRLINAKTWVGATDLLFEGEWIWMSSKDKVTYTHWASGEPNNAGGDNNCMEISEYGLWNDDHCSLTKHYICETEPALGKGETEAVG